MSSKWVRKQMKFVKFSKLLIMALFIAGSSVRAMDVPPLAPDTATPKTLDEQLFDAVGACDSILAKKLLDDGAEVNSVNHYGETPLHAIARLPDGTLGCEDIVILLLMRGANIEARSPKQGTPLHAAAFWGNRCLALLLLDKGAFVDVRGEGNITPLHLAALHGRTAVLQLLLDRGATVDAPTDVNATALHFAAHKGHTSIVHLLLGKRASIAAHGFKNVTVLHCAMVSDNASVVQLLLDHGAHVDAVADNKVTPLFLGVTSGSTKCIPLLLEHGASVDAQTTGNMTPLIEGAQHNNILVVEILLSYGARIPAALETNACVVKAQDNRAKLRQAKDFKTIAELLCQGAYAYREIKAFVDSKRQELFAAIDRNDVLTVARLLKDGFTLNTCDKQGNTVLHKAMQAKSGQVFALLLSLGAHVYLAKPNAQGVTPMQLLVDASQDAAKTLIRYGYNGQAQAVGAKRKEADQ